jgi:peptide/nickel transport system substrate-binding protein
MKHRIWTALLILALIAPAATTFAQDEMTYNEAPMLAAMVEAGDLPPVEERLPDNPRVLPVYDEIGTYGGTMRRAYKGLSDRWGPTKLIEENIFEFYMPDPDTIELVPTWIDEWSASDDASQYTFHIREGMKWSDGVPLTTEDVMFWYEDIFLNEDIYPNISSTYAPGGEPMLVEAVDDYTFTVSFASPYPLFPTIVAKLGTPRAIGAPFIQPKHYLMNFHADYVSEEELAAVVEEYNMEVWTDLWDEGPVQFWFRNPDLPVIFAWKMAVGPDQDQQIIVMERNPYYYSVDPEGNQLPYIDGITHEFFEDVQTLNLWVVQGKVDMQNRHLSIADYTLFKENEEAGGYRTVLWKNAVTMCIHMNINTPDEGLAALYNDERFREALNIAIDRDEINELVYLGLGEPRQASPISGSPQYDPEFEAKWVEYDPDRANALLDEMGLTERDGEGYRLRPDGETISINIESSSSGYAGTGDVLELVVAYWRDIGVKATSTIEERSLYEERSEQGEVDMGVWGLDRSSVVAADPGWYTGIYPEGPWAPLYGVWMDSGGNEGTEPPEDHLIRKVWAAWDKALTAATEEEALAYVQEMITLHRDTLYWIGIVGEDPAPFIVSNRIGNFPDGLIVDDTLRGQGLSQPAQLFLRQ